MINFNSFPNNVDFICDPEGCYSLGTALTTSHDSSNSICYPWDNTETALGFPKPEDSTSWIPEAYRTFRYLLLVISPWVANAMDVKKLYEEYRKFSKKYFPKKDTTVENEAITSTEEISREVVSPTESTAITEWQPSEESEALMERLRSISDRSLVVGKDIGNLTFASLTLTNSLMGSLLPDYTLPNSVTIALQSKKIISSFNKSRKLRLKEDKKLEFSESALKFSGSTMKMIFKYTINSAPGKILVESFSTAASALGSVTSYRKKVDINFMLGSILLMGGAFKLEQLVLSQLYSEEEAA